MCGSKCAWCENSMPTENGGWKCRYSICQMRADEIREIMLCLAGVKKY